MEQNQYAVPTRQLYFSKSQSSCSSVFLFFWVIIDYQEYGSMSALGNLNRTFISSNGFLGGRLKSLQHQSLKLLFFVGLLKSWKSMKIKENKVTYKHIWWRITNYYTDFAPQAYECLLVFSLSWFSWLAKCLCQR